MGVPWLLGEGLGRLRHHSPLRLDYRLVLLGSLLPDLIDKTHGLGLFPEEISGGRTVAHTLVFNLALIATGVAWWRLRRGNGVLALGLSSGGHLVLDSMWRMPAILFWPLYGWGLSLGSVSDWLLRFRWMLPSRPEDYATELIGGAILLFLLRGLWRRGRLVAFLKTGRKG